MPNLAQYQTLSITGTSLTKPLIWCLPEQQVNFVTRMVKHFCPGNDPDFQDHFPHRTTMSAFDLLSYCSVGN